MHRPRLGVFAPSGPFDPDRFARGCAILEGLGFELVIPSQVHERLGYLAGDDQTRLDVFHALLDDPNVEGLVAARGGYGAHRLLADLDPARLKANLKPIVGFSDICALHAAVQRVGGCMSVHGPVVTQLSDLAAADHARLAAVLTEAVAEDLMVADGATISPGRAEGRLVGGCLSVVTALLGTEHDILPDGAILLLEDVGEAPYRVDRMLTQLRLAGHLGRIAGIAVGDFVSCAAPRAHEPGIDEVLAERLGDLQIPVVTGFPIGHGARNHAVVLGAPAILDADAMTLTVHPST